MPNSRWDGTERRTKATDHDTLVQMVTLLKIHVENFDRHTARFDLHAISDEKKFDFLNKSVWTVFGGIAVLELFIKLAK